MPSSGPSGTVFAVTASPGTTGTTPARAIHPDPPSGRDGGARALVRGADRHHPPVAGLDRCDDARQRDRDPGGRAVGGDGHPHRRDGAAEQRPRAVRGDLVDLAEQHGLVRPRLLYILARHSATVRPTRGAPATSSGAVDGRGVRNGRLPGQLGGERGDPVAEVAQGAPEPRQGVIAAGLPGGTSATCGPPSSGSGCVDTAGVPGSPGYPGASTVRLVGVSPPVRTPLATV